MKCKRCVPPCAAKACAVRPACARVVGKLGAADPNLLEGPSKQMLVQGHIMRLVNEAREVGHCQRPRQENQDTQHMLDQPRGSFPEKCKP